MPVIETFMEFWELIVIFLLYGAYCVNLFKMQRWFPWGGF
jgi:hypothetical protein